MELKSRKGRYFKVVEGVKTEISFEEWKNASAKPGEKKVAETKNNEEEEASTNE